VLSIASLIVIILIAVFLIMDSDAIWGGLAIALIIGGCLFVKDLIVKLKEAAERSKVQSTKQEKERARSEKKNEK
jgi:hypothetical protein